MVVGKHWSRVIGKAAAGSVHGLSALMILVVGAIVVGLFLRSAGWVKLTALLLVLLWMGWLVRNLSVLPSKESGLALAKGAKAKPRR